MIQPLYGYSIMRVSSTRTATPSASAIRRSRSSSPLRPTVHEPRRAIASSASHSAGVSPRRDAVVGVRWRIIGRHVLGDVPVPVAPVAGFAGRGSGGAIGALGIRASSPSPPEVPPAVSQSHDCQQHATTEPYPLPGVHERTMQVGPEAHGSRLIATKNKNGKAA